MKILLSILLSTYLFADFTLIYEMDNGIEGKFDEIIQYKDEKHIKLSYRHADRNDSISKTGQYIIDGVRYTVLVEDGNLTYMNMDNIDKEMNLLSKELNISKELNLTSVDKKPFFKILKKGEPKDINGISGEVWEVESQEDGVKFKEEITVTNDKEIVRTMRISMKVLEAFGEGPYGLEIDSDLITMMVPSDTHVLLYAKGMNYKSLSHDKIDDSVFKLPEGSIDSMRSTPVDDPKEQNETASESISDVEASIISSKQHIGVSAQTTQEIFQKQKELLPQLLSQIQEARVCLENAFDVTGANSCLEKLVAVEADIGDMDRKDRTITEWIEPSQSSIKDGLEEEILDMKRRMPCIRRSQNFDDLSECMQAIPIE